MRISDWSSDVCSSDLKKKGPRRSAGLFHAARLPGCPAALPAARCDQIDVGHPAIAAGEDDIGEIAVDAAEHMLVTPDAMVAGIAGAQGKRVVIGEDALQRGRGPDIDDADVALAAIDAGGFGPRPLRLDAPRT